MSRTKTIFILTLSLLLLSSTGSFAQCAYAKSNDIVDTAIAAGNFKTLAAVLTKANLVSALKSKGPFTVFAPTDEAFAKLPKETIEHLLKPENMNQLVSILTFHVIPGKVMATQVSNLSNAKTLNGQLVHINNEPKYISINNAKVIQADINASNGVIHVIDTVLLPETKDIIGVALQAGNFKTLATALGAADLVKALQGKGPFTVFAPTDEAFAKLPEGTIAHLLKEENRDQLVQILMYHVVSGRSFTSEALAQRTFETLATKPITIALKNGQVYVNNTTKVIGTDINASNGVIHVIDSVLIPPKEISKTENSQIKSSEERMMDYGQKSAQLISKAIEYGVPLYNNGNAEACTSVYMFAAQAILIMEKDLPKEVYAPLQSAIEKAKNSNHAKEKAWIMRHGLDDSYKALNEMCFEKSQSCTY